MSAMTATATWFPYAEAAAFLLLVFITVFRRQLSSNDAYRSPTDMADAKSPVPTLTSVGSSSTISGGSGAPLPVTTSTTSAVSLDRMPIDVLLRIMKYIPRSSIGQLASVNRRLHRDTLSDAVWRQVRTKRSNKIVSRHRHNVFTNCCFYFTPALQLWMHRYRGLWTDPRICEIRRLRGITCDPTAPDGHPSTCDFMDPSLSCILALLTPLPPPCHRHHLPWADAFRPKTSWLQFYLEFEFAWLDWLLAGCNTDACCLLGLQGAEPSLSPPSSLAAQHSPLSACWGGKAAR